jgi:putative intracellular protease/amidase
MPLHEHNSSNGDTIMASDSLDGLMVAILITDGFEQVEMTDPRKALDQAGAKTRIAQGRPGEGLEAHGMG